MVEEEKKRLSRMSKNISEKMDKTDGVRINIDNGGSFLRAPDKKITKSATTRRFSYFEPRSADLDNYHRKPDLEIKLNSPGIEKGILKKSPKESKFKQSTLKSIPHIEDEISQRNDSKSINKDATIYQSILGGEKDVTLYESFEDPMEEIQNEPEHFVDSQNPNSFFMLPQELKNMSSLVGSISDFTESGWTNSSESHKRKIVNFGSLILGCDKEE